MPEGLARLETLWRASDLKVVASLEAIMALPHGSPERHEALAGLHMLQARWEWRDADRLRAEQRDRARRTDRRCSTCHQPGHTRRTCPQS